MISFFEEKNYVYITFRKKISNEQLIILRCNEMNTIPNFMELNCFQYNHNWFLLWLIVYHSGLLCWVLLTLFVITKLDLRSFLLCYIVLLVFCFSKYYTTGPLFSSLFVNKIYINVLQLLKNQYINKKIDCQPV